VLLAPRSVEPPGRLYERGGKPTRIARQRTEIGVNLRQTFSFPGTQFYAA
jgi:hypothetical protein